MLVHFFDFAQLNSVRALPYAIAWDRRYRDAGLATLGVHSPRFRFTADREALAAALERLGVEHPVADDSGYALWHDYGCEGWPSLFLWGQGGALRWFHFGEGEYAGDRGGDRRGARGHRPALTSRRRRSSRCAQATRPARSSCRRPTRSSPAARSPSPGARAATRRARAQLRGRRRPRDASPAPGELRVALDGGPERALAIAAPGLYDLAVHERHERHALRLRPSSGLELYSVSFSAGVP